MSETRRRSAPAPREARTPPARAAPAGWSSCCATCCRRPRSSLIALVVLWPQLIGGAGGLIAPIFANAEIDGTDVMLMHSPRYVGQTRDAEPYELTAASAYVDPKRPEPGPSRPPRRRARAARASAISTWSRCAGSYNRDRRQARPGRRHRADHQRRLSLRDRERADRPARRGQVIGEQPIQGSGPAGTLSADRFEIHDSGAAAALRGPGQGDPAAAPRRRDEAS